MPIVLSKRSYSEEAREDTGPFVAVNMPKLREPDRKVPVRAKRRSVEQDGAGAVHRSEAVSSFRSLQVKHAVLVVVEVATFLPEILRQDGRSLNLLVTGTVQVFSNQGFEFVQESDSSRKPEGSAGGFGKEPEEIHLASQFSVVAFSGFFAST